VRKRERERKKERNKDDYIRYTIVIMATTQGNVVRLGWREKVPVTAMKEVMQVCLQEKLANFTYEGEKCNEAAKYLSDTIRIRLKSLEYQRYKYIVHVMIGERKEQGVR
jgi:hypothetical protein